MDQYKALKLYKVIIEIKKPENTRISSGYNDFS